MKKKVLFIDRDGTLIREAPPTYQVDSFDKLVFYPGMFTWMSRIARELNYELVMVTNQDGLGTPSFPLSDFQPVHDFIMRSLENEGIHFRSVCIDRSFPADNLPTRKPGIAMLTKWIQDDGYDIPHSFVIGDRITDVQMALNLGCKAIWLNNDPQLGGKEVGDSKEKLAEAVALETQDWQSIYRFLHQQERAVILKRDTKETRINIKLNLDGQGKTDIKTGLHFFDHMLDQLGRHSGMDLSVYTNGDLHVDEHHTIEDTAIALGEALRQALGDKLGIERYGYMIPMDDSLATVAIDFGGRAWLVWDAEFKREKVGDMPTEMFYHFFKSFSDAARCNLYIQVKGDNEHHKIESVFKALAKAIRAAIKQDTNNMSLPSTKGVL